MVVSHAFRIKWPPHLISSGPCAPLQPRLPPLSTWLTMLQPECLLIPTAGPLHMLFFLPGTLSPDFVAYPFLSISSYHTCCLLSQNQRQQWVNGESPCSDKVYALLDPIPLLPGTYIFYHSTGLNIFRALKATKITFTVCLPLQKANGGSRTTS